MKTVFKYQLQVADTQEVLMPKEAIILCADSQGEDICIWALVETENISETRTIRVAGTGHLITENNLQYISTVKMLHDSLIFHVFEVKK